VTVKIPETGLLIQVHGNVFIIAQNVTENYESYNCTNAALSFNFVYDYHSL